MITSWARSPSVQRSALGLGLLGAAVIAVVAYNSLSIGFGGGLLAPAKEPSVDSLCTQPLDLTAKGVLSPLFCADGSINTLAWSDLAADHPVVMTVGRNAGPKEVRSAVVQDLQYRMSGTAECEAAMLAAAYYGWNFHIDPVDGLSLDCPVQK